jgi:flagella basal body P-ring formation protein FlgA
LFTGFVVGKGVGMVAQRRILPGEIILFTGIAVGKGVGMVAQRRILPGEIILEEKPLLIVPDEIYEGMRDNIHK